MCKNTSTKANRKESWNLQVWAFSQKVNCLPVVWCIGWAHASHVSQLHCTSSTHFSTNTNTQQATFFLKRTQRKRNGTFAGSRLQPYLNIITNSRSACHHFRQKSSSQSPIGPHGWRQIDWRPKWPNWFPGHPIRRLQRAIDFSGEQKWTCFKCSPYCVISTSLKKAKPKKHLSVGSEGAHSSIYAPSHFRTPVNALANILLQVRKVCLISTWLWQQRCCIIHINNLERVLTLQFNHHN